MKVSVLLLCMMVPCAVAQTNSVELTVVHADAPPKGVTSNRVKAVFPNGEGPPVNKPRKIKYYPRPVPFEFRGAEGELTWFSYTNPPKDKNTFFVEADQPILGSLLYRGKLYVCSSSSAQSSIPVINALLSSASSASLTEDEARSMALLFAKCSDTVQIYGDEQSSFEDAQKRMQNVAVPPVVRALNGEISVVLYSWSALPVGEISKWSFLFRAKEIVSVRRDPVSETGLYEQGQRPQEGTLLHESGHADPPKPQ